MATFFEELLEGADPARFAAMAETLPEPPSFERHPARGLRSAGGRDRRDGRSRRCRCRRRDRRGRDRDRPGAETSDRGRDHAGPGTGRRRRSDDRVEVRPKLEGVEPTGEPVDRARRDRRARGRCRAAPPPPGAGRAESATSAEDFANVAETAAKLLRQGRGPRRTPVAGATPTSRVPRQRLRWPASRGRQRRRPRGRRRVVRRPPCEPDAAPRSRRVTSENSVPPRSYVVGLVSVAASIASFKRHLGRVRRRPVRWRVVEGPDGEFHVHREPPPSTSRSRTRCRSPGLRGPCHEHRRRRG